MTKEHLVRYAGLNLKARRLCAELEQLATESQPFAERRLPDLERQIGDTLAEMESIQVAVRALPDPLEQEVLTLRYLSATSADLPAWQSIAEQLYGRSGEAETKRISRLHRAALKHLESIPQHLI